MNSPTPEFSRLLSVARIPTKGVEEHLEAKPAERAALAARFDLIELSRLEADVSLTPGENDVITATGTLTADAVQRCVVTLEALPIHIEIPVDVTFLPEETNAPDAGVIDEAELDKEFEFYTSGKIDLGEMIAQQLGVSLPPYPHRTDAQPFEREYGEKAEKTNPFAVLLTAKSKKNN